jgi:hypothetical protein
MKHIAIGAACGLALATYLFGLTLACAYSALKEELQK